MEPVQDFTVNNRKEAVKGISVNGFLKINPKIECMKDLNLVSIQGKYAPSYWLKCKYEFDFCSTIEAITQKPAVILSSPKRTDLFYQSKKDQAGLFIRIWGLYLSKKITDQEINFFQVKKGTLETLDYYFSSLNCLKHRKNEFKTYKKYFANLYNQLSDHPILTTLYQCDKHLHTTNTLKKRLLKFRSINKNRFFNPQTNSSDIGIEKNINLN